MNQFIKNSIIMSGCIFIAVLVDIYVAHGPLSLLPGVAFSIAAGVLCAFAYSKSGIKR